MLDVEDFLVLVVVLKLYLLVEGSGVVFNVVFRLDGNDLGWCV